jgi:hypothetical protein
VFALVLFMVFEVSTTLDALTSAPLAAWVGQWEPDSTAGVVGRAVADGLVGLVGIVVPYMLPLVLLLVSLEESGIMHRVAFVVDRGFHRIGLHGGVAVPFLLGLGCNVPALSAVAASSAGRERIVASLLITFVPCSARSAIVLAIGGKYLGWEGVLGIFADHADHRGGRQAAHPPLRAGQPRHDPGHPALRAAPMAPPAGDHLGAHQRHPDHRHAAAGAGQRGAGAARPLWRRRVHQHPAAARHPLVAGAAGGARGAYPVRRAAQGARC